MCEGLQNFLGTITQEPIAAGLGRRLHPAVWSAALLHSCFPRDPTGFAGAAEGALDEALQQAEAAAGPAEFVTF